MHNGGVRQSSVVDGSTAISNDVDSFRNHTNRVEILESGILTSTNYYSCKSRYSLYIINHVMYTSPFGKPEGSLESIQESSWIRNHVDENSVMRISIG